MVWGWHMTATAECFWCDKPFEPKKFGAHQRRFCSASCKNAYHTALRKSAQQALADGRITVTDLKAL